MTKAAHGPLDKSRRSTLVRWMKILHSLRVASYVIDYDPTDHRIIWRNRDALEPLPLMSATEEEVLALLTALSISGSVLDAGRPAGCGRTGHEGNVKN